MKIFGLIESEEFTLALTLIAEPHKADEAMAELLYCIAIRPESFPIILYPNQRMILGKFGELTIVVFFCILPDRKHIELLRLLLKIA